MTDHSLAGTLSLMMNTRFKVKLKGNQAHLWADLASFRVVHERR